MCINLHDNYCIIWGGQTQIILKFKKKPEPGGSVHKKINIAHLKIADTFTRNSIVTMLFQT